MHIYIKSLIARAASWVSQIVKYYMIFYICFFFFLIKSFIFVKWVNLSFYVDGGTTHKK